MIVLSFDRDIFSQAAACSLFIKTPLSEYAPGEGFCLSCSLPRVETYGAIVQLVVCDITQFVSIPGLLPGVTATRYHV